MTLVPGPIDQLLEAHAKLKLEVQELRALLAEAVSKMRMVENHVCPPDEWDETVEAIEAALRGESDDGPPVE